MRPQEAPIRTCQNITHPLSIRSFCLAVKLPPPALGGPDDLCYISSPGEEEEKKEEDHKEEHGDEE